MKRSLALLLTLVMSLGLLAGCGSKDTTADESQQDGESGAKQIETLKVAFVPSREPQEIITATEPLKQLLKDELAKEGYERSARSRSPSAPPTKPSARALRPVRSTSA